jgi:hypothetical protein
VIAISNIFMKLLLRTSSLARDLRIGALQERLVYHIGLTQFYNSPSRMQFMQLHNNHPSSIGENTFENVVDMLEMIIEVEFILELRRG